VLRTGSGRLGGAGSGDGLGVRPGTGSRIGSTTIFLSGFPISINASFPRVHLHDSTDGAAPPGGAHVRAQEVGVPFGA
jgi:hypothetical protein